MKGSIKNLLNGFGFITPEDGDKDIFFHSNDLEGLDFDSLKVGDVVTFDIGQSEKGPKAENVALVETE
ncbi:MAG: cold shock domain-containing protein [Candidatus Gracilibacteria bacterium]|nr:cold shock domain-containing protein [Candidatus Gracilibacteria bacterium]